MKNHRFPWLRNRTTDNRKCEKARNIKEKCTIEMFNTVSRKLVEHLSSANVNFVYPNYKFQTAATTSQGSNPLGGFFVECALVISCTCRCG